MTRLKYFVWLLIITFHWTRSSADRDCPKNWNSNKFLCWKKSAESLQFDEALEYCLKGEFINGPRVGLISVGKLRHFRNRYDYHSEVHRHGIRLRNSRLYRVNGRKDDDNVWREHPSGREIEFHHHPGFRPEAGHKGSTLVWDSKTDRLLIVEDHEQYPPLCHRAKQNVCQRCPDFDWDSECSNSGDCLHGTCKCDQGFSGFKCQVPPIRNAELMVFGGANLGVDDASEFYDFEKQALCSLPKLPIENSLFVSGTVFGRPYACGGDAGNIHNQCWFFNRDEREWQIIDDMQNSRRRAAATEVTVRGRDRFWWISGGEGPTGGGGSTELKSSELLMWYGKWEEGPNLPLAYDGHCAIQTNECETAVLGGRSGTNELDYIFIYNWEDERWKAGPRLEVDRAFFQCARIRDPNSGHLLVVSACGQGDFGTTNSVEVWDTMTWDTYELEHQCPNDVAYFDQAHEVSDHEIIFTGGAGAGTKGIWSFTMEGGFQRIGEWAEHRLGGGSALLPQGFNRCHM